MIDQHDITSITEILSLRAEEVKHGRTKPLDLYTFLYQLEKVCKELKDEIIDEVIDEVDKYGKDGCDHGGYKMTVNRTSRWTYNDDEIDRLKALMKARQDLMKQASRTPGMTDQYGEVIPEAEQKTSTYIKMEYKR